MRVARILSIGFAATAAFLVAALAAPTGASAASGAAAADTAAVAAEQCALTSFDAASVIKDDASGALLLIVKGTVPASNVTVKLVPAVYIQQPEYWEIEVFGCTSGIGLPVLTPYAVKLDVTHTVGTIGIEVVGSNGRLQIPLFPGPVK